ncbi:alkylhydroperoxidase [Exiguobacterium indicum]|uniref:carboxymuconolactone decarboxylase family protein n=1 Tax=Exiguobacterium indicum TaxID=296995 RepID=UPI0007365CCF|nr:carboxymuconolactone decarboxylase family protein [Exiguobacterium indicum]KTR59990.1 alkylhydroperoxidase [Exiguobacterium indicum]
MTKIPLSQIGETPFQKLLGHNTKILNSWTMLERDLVEEGILSSDLKEQVRRTLAQSNGCAYCKAKGKPKKNIMDEKMILAIGFADLFLTVKGNIPDSIFSLMKETFTAQEISELCAFITFCTASQYFGAIMNLQPTDIPDSTYT